MPSSSINRRNWLKVGALGSAGAFLPTISKAQSGPRKVNGVVFMVADGMSHGVLSMAENFSKVLYGKGTRWWQLLSAPDTTHGLMETSSANSYVTDSAAASSAWGGGVKINNRSVNVRPDGTFSEPIMQTAKALGHRTALVTTTSITHATPAGFAAVAANRTDEHLIAPQYLDTVDILLGGGMKYFDPSSRVDSRDVLGLFQKNRYHLMKSLATLRQAPIAERYLGLFAEDHLPYDVDRLESIDLLKTVPTLAEMSSFALSKLLKEDKKFLLQIEGGRIDHGAHANDAAGLLHDQLAFDRAIGVVSNLLRSRSDILLVITSDHGNANPGLNGTGPEYTATNSLFHSLTRTKCSYEKLLIDWGMSGENSIENLSLLVSERLGFDMKDEELNTLFASLIGRPITQWSDQLSSPFGLLGQFHGNHNGIGWSGVSHTADPTQITAVGPQSDRFAGIIPNHEIHGHLLELLS